MSDAKTFIDGESLAIVTTQLVAAHISAHGNLPYDIGEYVDAATNILMTCDEQAMVYRMPVPNDGEKNLPHEQA